METCVHCARRLKHGLLFLDAKEVPTTDPSKARWKSCPRCSVLAKAHVFLPLPRAFGKPVPGRITARNPLGFQSDCTHHRNSAGVGGLNPGAHWRLCGGIDPTTTQVLVYDKVGALRLDSEGERRLVVHFVADRSRRNRELVLANRRKSGKPLACESCATVPGDVLGPEFRDMVEVHHRRPLALGTQKPAAEDFALLCPTCHRAVHWGRALSETMDVDELERRLLAGRKGGPVR